MTDTERLTKLEKKLNAIRVVWCIAFFLVSCMCAATIKLVEDSADVIDSIYIYHSERLDELERNEFHVRIEKVRGHREEYLRSNSSGNVNMEVDNANFYSNNR